MQAVVNKKIEMTKIRDRQFQSTHRCIGFNFFRSRQFNTFGYNFLIFDFDDFVMNFETACLKDIRTLATCGSDSRILHISDEQCAFTSQCCDTQYIRHD